MASLFAVLAMHALPAQAAGYPARLERAVAKQLAKEQVLRHLPGATAGFALPDGRSGGAAVGYSDIERTIPMRSDSRMPAGSIGKTFVAALTLSLASEGRLSLDDKLSKWIGDTPWFARLPNAADISIRDLLNHSGGIENHVETECFSDLVLERAFADPRKAIEPGLLVECILDKPALFPSSTGYAYTDTGYILLQLAIEKAGGFRFGEEVERRFLYPLQLNLTGPAEGLLHPGVAQGYPGSQSLPGLPATTLDGGVFRWNPMTEWAGGGFISNSRDLARWGSDLFAGSALPPGVGNVMVGAPNLNTAATGFVYGLGVTIRHVGGRREWGHGGVYPGYRSVMIYFPDCRIAVAVQTNTDDIASDEMTAVGRAIARVVFDQYSCPIEPG